MGVPLFTNEHARVPIAFRGIVKTASFAELSLISLFLPSDAHLNPDQKHALHRFRKQLTCEQVLGGLLEETMFNDSCGFRKTGRCEYLYRWNDCYS